MVTNQKTKQKRDAKTTVFHLRESKEENGALSTWN